LLGPRFVPVELIALYGNGPSADGRLQKYFAAENGWPIRCEPTARPPTSITLPLTRS